MSEGPRKVIMSGRLVNLKQGVITATGIQVRRDVALPFAGEQVMVTNDDSGRVFDGEVTRVDWARNSYDIKMRVE